MSLSNHRFEVLAVDVLPDRVIATMNRPETRNAIDQAMVDEFHTLCDWLERNPRVLIITGTTTTGTSEGQGIFASGADIAQLRERGREDALRGVNSRAFDRIHRLAMPVIAAIDGYALGGGAELAYAADLRIATPRLKLGQPEVGLGIAAAAGGLWRLKELVGEPVALEMLLTGRVLDADESLHLNLVTALHEPEELLGAAHVLADRITVQDPLAVRLTKQVFHMPRDSQPGVSDIAQAILFESAAKYDRMQSFLERSRRPRADRSPSAPGQGDPS